MKLLVLIFLLSITQVMAWPKRVREECPETEWYDFCFNGCEPTCYNPEPKCSKLCGWGGCTCRGGYVREDEGECILDSECR
ncbi:hypothetical protein RB195_005255 [Necator americanus]|uniref:Trypsin Inhibitor like cysteine rich domain protein n=2 Tax=Necator americanus TaxID=51031 RepID=W2TF72_NECAM|nr:trypsin Inhibitor like cysteine rich domain protein [Necator americanus]ETN80244.1 trypsin Inhibitor like cysteine rich domain protein [Necator americanus]